MDIIRASFYTFGTKVLLFFLSIFTSIIVLRSIGPEGNGILSLFNTFFGYVISFTLLSVGSGLIYYSNVSKTCNIYFSSASFFVFVIVLLDVLILMFFRKYFTNILFYGVSAYIYLLGVVLLLTNAFDYITNSLARATQNFMLFNYSLVLHKVIYLMLILVLLIIDRISITSILIIMGFATVISSSYIYIKNKNIFDYKLIKLKVVKQMLSFSIKEHLGTISQKLNLRLDIFVLAQYSSMKEIGLYGLAVTFGELLWYIPDSIGTFLFPKISGAVKQNESIEMVCRINRITNLVLVLLILIAFFISDIMFILIYGEAFTASSSPFRLLIVGILFLSNAKILTKYFSGIGKPMINTSSTLLGILINIPLLFFLIPNYGINGAAIASSISYLITSIYCIYKFKKVTNRSYNDFLIFSFKDWFFLSKKIKELSGK